MTFDRNFENQQPANGATAQPFDILKLLGERRPNPGNKSGPGTGEITSLDCSAPFDQNALYCRAEKAADPEPTLAAKQHAEHEKNFKIHGDNLREALKLPATSTLDQTTEALARLRKKDLKAYQELDGSYLQRNMPSETSAYIRKHLDSSEHQQDLNFHGRDLKKALDLPASARLEDVIQSLATLQREDLNAYAKINSDYLAQNMPSETSAYIRQKILLTRVSNFFEWLRNSR